MTKLGYADFFDFVAKHQAEGVSTEPGVDEGDLPVFGAAVDAEVVVSKIEGEGGVEVDEDSSDLALAVRFQSIYIKNDHDTGAGEIYMEYDVSDGINGNSGGWGPYDIHTRHSKPIGKQVAVFDDVDTLITVNVSVMESDWGSDGYLGEIDESFDAADNFGIGEHTVNGGDFELTFSIVPV